MEPQHPDYLPSAGCDVNTTENITQLLCSEPQCNGNKGDNQADCEAKGLIFYNTGGKWILDLIPPVKQSTGTTITERICKEIALGYPVYKGHCNNSDAKTKSACDAGMWQPAIDPAPEHPMSVMPTYTATYKCHNEYCTIGNPANNKPFPDEYSCIGGGGEWIIPPPITNKEDCEAGGNAWLEDEPIKSNKGLDLLTSLSSPAAIVMGHETGIGMSPRNYKGVIYAPNIERSAGWGHMSAKDVKTYTKHGVQENERAVWSRHGGSFDILIGFPPPENNCHDVNSTTPTNLNWNLKFDQICCNVRGPLSYYKCADRCSHSYEGPLITDLPFNYETDGVSELKVNVHDAIPYLQ
tara:strand:- start:609 stop:1664 length:1056 start_codon:yes stop_codon:yes gene_type:complete